MRFSRNVYSALLSCVFPSFYCVCVQLCLHPLADIGVWVIQDLLHLLSFIIAIDDADIGEANDIDANVKWAR